MSTFKHPFKTFALLALAFGIAFPFGAPIAEAQSSRDWRAWYEAYQRSVEQEDDSRSDRSRSSSRSSSRERYSSATQREINRLDRDPVEAMPIPVMFGITLSRISPDFGDPRGGGTREHEGQDMIAPRGTPIASPTDAVVTRTGNGSSSGLYVYTANPGGQTFRYMHLDGIADGIRAGSVLKPGSIIGFVGDTGNAQGGVTHLHFEVREGGRALDPYPLLAREFSQKERLDGIEAYTEELGRTEGEAFARFLVTNYRSFFVQAKLAGATLPREIEDALGTVTATVAAGVARDLTLGSQGDDVIALQVALIALDKGPAAKALAGAGSTGYFGAMTQAALAEYQRASGISPAAGYYGALTRAYMAANPGR